MRFRVTYDKKADAVYIYLGKVRAGESAGQVEAIPDKVILDFDATGRLIGIEILGAGGILPPGVCEEAEQIGD